jgi:hypothetical protein
MERSGDRKLFHSFDEMMEQPFWRRVLPWWWSLVIMLGPLLRIATGSTRGWWLGVDLVLLVAIGVSIVVDVRRRRRRREASAPAMAASDSRAGEQT